MSKQNKELKRREHPVKCAGLHVRENTGGGEPSRTITGYAILFDSISDPLYDDGVRVFREVIAPGAVDRALLDGCDIKFTLFHDYQQILARSNKGAGTLSYDVDDKGVSFTFDAPQTADGDKALELVRRGDISGCSFAFSTYYDDEEYVERKSEKADGKTEVTCTVKKILGVYDFTLTTDPAYPATSVEARELFNASGEKEENPDAEEISRQIAEMREAAKPCAV